MQKLGPSSAPHLGLPGNTLTATARLPAVPYPTQLGSVQLHPASMSSKPKAEAKVAVLKGQEGSFAVLYRLWLVSLFVAEDKILEYVKKVCDDKFFAVPPRLGLI